MKLLRHISFLKQVIIYSLSAFGGPQGHLGMMLKTFVNKRKDVTTDELFEFNSFCQMLPGASSTQIITLIGYKRGGILLGIITFLLWIAPACFIMGALSFYISRFEHTDLNTNLFRFIQPMVIGFLLYAATSNYKHSIRNLITFIIMTLSIVLTYLYIRTPWVFPLLIIAGGVATNFSKKRIPKIQQDSPKKIRWTNVWLFFIIFAIAGFLSESARKNNWENRKAFNLFENFYRFGSFVFGGGDVLLPMMLDQYVVRPKDPKTITQNPDIIKIEKSQLLTGYGMVRAIPGPVFSVAAYVGGLSLSKKGIKQQLLGCAIASIAIFLPSILLVFFFFPVWQYLKKYVVVLRSLEGINAVVTGIMFAGALYLFHEMYTRDISTDAIIPISVIVLTFLLLKYTRIPAPVIVLSCLFFGWIFQG